MTTREAAALAHVAGRLVLLAFAAGLVAGWVMNLDRSERGVEAE